MDNPFKKPERQEQPYRRKIELMLTDHHLNKTVKITHEVEAQPDYRDLKKDLKGKVGILLDAIYN